MGRSDSSVRSPSQRREPRSSRSDGAPATDFAITTINVPDRLDLQEVRAREAETEYARGRRLSLDRYAVTVWAKRVLAVAVVVGLGWLAVTASVPLVEGLRAESIAARLSAAVGEPVRIAERRFLLWPRPQLSLVGVEVGARLRADEVSLRLSWSELAQAARAGRLAFSEAVVAPMRVDGAQAWEAVALAPRLAGAGGVSVGTLRFSAVEFVDLPLLPHQYVVTLRPPAAAVPVGVEVRQIGAEGSARLSVAAVEESLRFELEAQGWRAPVGPGVVWDSVSAQGRVLPTAVVVETYTASAPFGVFQGALVAAVDVGWSVAGTSRAVSVDLESLMRALSGPGAEQVDAPRPVLAGTATAELLGGGHGPSLADAMFGARLTGPVAVRFGTLHGINLGLVATQGGSTEFGGGITRFTELSAQVDAGESAVLFRDVRGSAGAMATRGQITVQPDLRLSGVVRVDLGAERVHAPTTLRVSGTALAPRFNRP